MLRPSSDAAVSLDFEPDKCASEKQQQQQQQQCPWSWNNPYKHLIPAWSLDVPAVSPTPCLDCDHLSTSTTNSQMGSRDSDLDMRRISATVDALRQSNFYYECLSWQDATKLLLRTPVGTFLVRDSSDPHHLFTLSVQTTRGPTSVRLHYADGQFCLDSEPRLVGLMPLFDCVVDMIQYYMTISDTPKSKSCVWVDNITGRRDMPIRLKQPLYKSVMSLQHLCRLRVNSVLTDAICSRDTALDTIRVLPPAIKKYLNKYPHCV